MAKSFQLLAPSGNSLHWKLPLNFTSLSGSSWHSKTNQLSSTRACLSHCLNSGPLCRATQLQNVGLMEAFMAVKLLPLLNPGVGPRSSSNKHLACWSLHLWQAQKTHRWVSHVWLSRPSRQSGIYNFSNGKQLIMGEAQGTTKPTWRLRGVHHSWFRDP